ncbi:translation initiation factor IF-2-like isoform X1 [Triticum dicoccoides]|uniref:translation initiation factor IF-2-like isoform X1 n=1 Tax=Triticum dicoccoides TaxID=85692 RepID=UPI0018916285|nr:translation initiation factor IF-2-like isoform X1 [Triticum dicoccoides]XP_037468147.1 translation initiation factor IF-2-like isoform X1 [Triticum dicoccoides]XP_037468148.1 translation initiation factor IF-2-like isoform X1 [Triticum dicoccoides]XP_037468149.1 translation initiation factor IF-2-like isoform X1 [Triticum dicoccoides]XP_037468150.1 translation initiation factor IF-2-like isoform X1 [Triticum dicoccoides]XP_037468151.1 translation initiation factor IF-2-like isoform X1 [Tri
MAYAVPPGDDDDLMNVLRLPLRQLPAWVNKDDLYRDVPHVVAGDSVQSTDGAGRPAYYVLTPLRAMGGRTSRTVGAGYWKVEKTVKLPTADGAGSSKMAPHGTCAKLSFISRPPGGPEGRNGWLMKQYLLPHAPGAPAGPALCKLYFKKSAAAASTTSTAAAAGKAAAAARPSRLPASAPSRSFFLKKPAAEAPSTAVPPATKAATSQDAGARPLRLRVPTSTTYASRLRLPASIPYSKILKKPPAEAPSTAAKAPSRASSFRRPASTPCPMKKPAAEAPPAAEQAPAKAAEAPSTAVKAPSHASSFRPPASIPCLKKPAAEAPSTAAKAPSHASSFRPPASIPCLKKPAAEAPPAAAPAPAKAEAAPCASQDSTPPLRRQLSPGTTPGRRWVLVETEATSPPPQPNHDRILKRIYKLAELEVVDVEEGELLEQGHYLRKKGKFSCDKSSFMLLKDDYCSFRSRELS